MGLLELVLLLGSVHAQQPARPELRASRVATAPTVDGEVLSEAVWADVEVATGFVQVQPFEGQPASERTEVRVAFDDQMLYIAVVCYDSEPSSLAVSDSRRDANLEEEDSFRVILDTFHDRQNGFIFGTNLAGVQYDGQVTNEGRTGGGSGRRGSGPGGGGGSANLDWDTSWTVRSKTGDVGWSAELAIPFRSLRYGSGGSSWGINFERNIRRRSETAFWAPLGREFSLFRLSAAGTLLGIETPKQRNLQVIPYALTEVRDDGVTDRRNGSEVGFDLKYGVTPSLTLDVTVNTDFAQVEVDDQQINLDRFSLLFPEKRPFFLENAGLFKIGTSGGGPPGSGSVDLFFSRRIGLDDGEQVPIVGGVRLSGKAAGLNVGFLNMQTEEHGGLQANNFTVGRVSREFRNRSRAGAMVVNRQGTGSLAPDGDHNRTFGVDGQLGIGQYTDLSGWAAKTETPGLEGRDHAFGIDSNFNSPFWRLRGGYSEVGAEFNPEVGFVNRSDYRRLSSRIQRRYRPTGRGRIKEYGPSAFYDSYWKFSGFHESERFSLGGQLELRSGAQINLFVGQQLERLQESFEIIDGVVVPEGSYSNDTFFVFFNTNRSSAISLGGFIQGGGFYNGNQLALNPSLNFRLSDYLSSELSWSNSDVDLETGAFETNLGRLRVTYAFSTRLLLQALVQYNDVTDDVSTNLRFSWLGDANTGLFVVYNEVSEFGSSAVPRPDRSLVLKYSRLFDLFR
ncbi:MAG: DUF5916 domain-containing protein [Acidobacteriota bacterium]|nr:DUF5916 domain-containing protein [Acidobacteriota bacterium]